MVLSSFLFYCRAVSPLCDYIISHYGKIVNSQITQNFAGKIGKGVQNSKYLARAPVRARLKNDFDFEMENRPRFGSGFHFEMDYLRSIYVLCLA